MTQSVDFKLGEFRRGNETFTGVVFPGGVVSLAVLAARCSTAIELVSFTTLQDLLADWDRAFAALQRLAEFAMREGLETLDVCAFQSLIPRAPIARPHKMLYAAGNYSEHVKGMLATFTSGLPPAGSSQSAAILKPYLFAKACAQTGAHDDIVLPPGMARTDWEAELAVVVGRRGRNIPAERVANHIAGYMTTNDVSCRDLTWREDRPAIRSDWLSGKSFDTFAPMGPFFTPKVFVPDHSNLFIRLWVNGQLKQDGNSGDMIFGIEDQFAYASGMMTLLPGDIFATGTPAGTGQERMEFLKAGDVVETEVELCGRQKNKVVNGEPSYR